MTKEKAKLHESKRTVLIELPIGDIVDAPYKIHVDGDLPPRQANALRTVMAGLNGKLGMFSTDGRVKNVHAVRFILEAVALQLDAIAINPDESRLSGVK